VIKGAMTVLANQDVLPVQDLANLKIASVMIGAEHISPFQKMMDKYTQLTILFWVKMHREGKCST
jgi:beta-N-acetylhexosaminidase